MRIRRLGGMGMLLLIILGACLSSSSNRPDDFSISFYWNTGSLPPKYHYKYVITLGPGLQGEFEYQPGYDQDQAYFWSTTFSVSESAFDDLFSTLQQESILKSRWNTGEGLIGGSTTDLIITAYGKEYHIPSIHKLKTLDQARVETAMDAIRAVVPQSVWDEMEARQTAYENTFGDE